MADDFIQVAVDGAGKKVDNSSMAIWANTVYRQRVVVSDNASTGNHLAVDANGNVGISNTSFTVIAMNAGTITAATISNFPASQPVTGTFWQATQPVSFSAGTVSFSAGTVTNATVTAATVGAATVTAGTVSANQGTANATPWNENLAQIGGTTVGAVTKGSQAANALGVQDFKDSGRTPIAFTADRITGTTAETLLTVTINKNGTTSSASTYAVTAGKTLRLQFAGQAARATSTTTISSRVRIRSNATSAVATTASPVFVALECSSLAALAESTGVDEAAISDGLEFAAGTNIGFSHIESATSATVSLNAIGFEY